MLDTLAESEAKYTGGVILTDGLPRRVAHRVVGHRDHCPDTEFESACGVTAPRPLTPTDEACWFAVPCRECFPEAPPLGYDGTSETYFGPRPLLEWQLSR